MKDELLRKIQHVLDGRITNEMKVMYLLVELRKLMDRDGYQDPVLRMFTNWVVHTSLTKRASGSTLVLSEFDYLMVELLEHKRNSRRLEHISLSALRRALIRCFKHFDLSAKFVADGVEWKKFAKLYSLIVSECPIVFTASNTKLKYIKKVELTGVAPGVLVKEWPIVEWRLTFHDGHTMNWVSTWGEQLPAIESGNANPPVPYIPSSSTSTSKLASAASIALASTALVLVPASRDTSPVS